MIYFMYPPCYGEGESINFVTSMAKMAIQDNQIAIVENDCLHESFIVFLEKILPLS